ncbi:MAG: TetR family transcriptional regulator [Deltaproteobacteria bacterium]|nr:TetR family transcriptional regulator [Deltaproteobacteria bacterium]
MPPPRHTPKKSPQQHRSRLTVDYILQAAAQILEAGSGRLSTNAIAQRAGVAIASLYQYFPNKESILRALFEADLAEERAELDRRTGELQGRPLTDIIRAGVRSMIAVHAKKPKRVKSILESLPLLGGAELLAKARQEVIALIASTMRERKAELRVQKDFEIQAFLVVQAVEGAVHAAASERPEWLGEPAFEAQLVELVERYLLP